MTGRLPELAAALVPIEAVPSLESRHRSAGALRSAAYVAPWSEAVTRVLETERYRRLPTHVPGYIAEQLAITVSEEQAALEILRRGRALRMQRGGRYAVRDDQTVDTRGDRQRVTRLLEHWTAVAGERASARGSDDLFAYNVFAIAAHDLPRAREILRGAYRELRTLVAASSPLERVALVNVQLLLLDAGGDQARG